MSKMGISTIVPTIDKDFPRLWSQRKAAQYFQDTDIVHRRYRLKEIAKHYAFPR